jgi:hypothetical protein
MGWLSLIAIVLGSAAVSTAMAARSAGINFRQRIKALQRSIEKTPKAAARANLPCEVAALAQRLGVSPAEGGRVVHLTQCGKMWLKPGANPVTFTAQQTSAVADVEFLWQSRVRMSGLSVRIIDYLVGGEGGLEGRLLDTLPIVRTAHDDAAFRGEAMRYLAELMWNPDALLFNPHIDWRVINARTLAAATGKGARRSEVRLILDEGGDPVRAEADDRTRVDDGVPAPCPWFAHGRDYRTVGGRRLPTLGEAGWIVGGKEFTYFRARVTSWLLDP